MNSHLDDSMSAGSIRRDRCAADVVLPRCVLASRRRGIHGGDTSFRSHTHNGLRHAICFGRIRVARRGADCTSQFVLSAVAKLAGIHPRRRMTPAMPRVNRPVAVLAWSVLNCHWSRSPRLITGIPAFSAALMQCRVSLDSPSGNARHTSAPASTITSLRTSPAALPYSYQSA